MNLAFLHSYYPFWDFLFKYFLWKKHRKNQASGFIRLLVAFPFIVTAYFFGVISSNSEGIHFH
jgi:hypothetical protein